VVPGVFHFIPKEPFRVFPIMSNNTNPNVWDVNGRIQAKKTEESRYSVLAAFKYDIGIVQVSV
jgi:hypothetical protein